MEILTVYLPTDTVDLLPVARSRLRNRYDDKGALVSTGLRELFVSLQSYWLENLFSTADVVASEEGWRLMLAIVDLLPQADSPAITGFNLEAMSNDYTQLEALFFCESKGVEVPQTVAAFNARFNLDEFVGSSILSLHRFNARKILEDAEAERGLREETAIVVQTKPAKKMRRAA